MNVHAVRMIVVGGDGLFFERRREAQIRRMDSHRESYGIVTISHWWDHVATFNVHLLNPRHNARGCTVDGKDNYNALNWL
jgi:hypothetical protein